MSAPILEVLRLHKRYGDAVALDEVSFTVDEGELFGLLGPNGAGKTTLLSIIAGLLAPTSGAVHLLGRPLDRATRRLIGIVPQELAIYGELSARENLSFFGELYGLKGPELRRRVDEVLAAVGLEDRADGRADTFSGGMKRRLNLGAALVHDPPLLLLDEPTSQQDESSVDLVVRVLEEEVAAGRTVLTASHDPRVVSAATSVLELDQGRARVRPTVAADPRS